MKLSIISTSQQKNSQSKRVSEIFKNIILEMDNKIECFNLDMFENKIPLWTSEKIEDLSFWEDHQDKISNHLKASDGFIFVVPEYGGSGQRLWPESRKKLPKQFINLLNDKTLFELTLSRIKSLKDCIKPIIVTNEEYRFYVANSLKKCSVDALCVNEPLSKNTTAAIYLSAKFSKPNDELLIMPSDHFIKEETLFSKIVTKSYKEKKCDQFIVFGVEPKSPHTGYGYIDVLTNSNNNQNF